MSDYINLNNQIALKASELLQLISKNTKVEHHKFCGPSTTITVNDKLVLEMESLGELLHRYAEVKQ